MPLKMRTSLEYPLIRYYTEKWDEYKAKEINNEFAFSDYIYWRDYESEVDWTNSETREEFLRDVLARKKTTPLNFKQYDSN